MKRVLVLGTGVITLGVIQAYGRAGIQVVHLTSKPDDPGSFSKYVQDRIRVPETSKEKELLECLWSLPKELQGVLLDVTHDPGIVFIAQNHSLLAKYYVLVTPPWKNVQGIINKKMLYVKADEMGVPTPHTIYPETIDDLNQKIDRVQFPCILKPYQTTDFYTVYEKKVLTANDPISLRNKFAEVSHYGLNVMVSEIIPGPDSNIFAYISYIDRTGRVLADVCVQKIQQHPYRFGVGSVVRTVPMNSKLREYSLRLLGNNGYYGISDAEFKFDSRDKKFKLIEINTRNTLFNQIFRKAGINFSSIQYEDNVNKRKVEFNGYQTGVYWIHGFFYIKEFWKNIKTRYTPIRSFFYPCLQKKIFAVPCFADLRPFGKYWKAILLRVLRRKVLGHK
ncbi:MAG: hypothetical protein SVY10_15445 [Thermodesulfobacteriota bacterium]|nr:hypothetical protein [Thermodesulfobacteriota bacterium]